jgi:hypothetical protein
MKIFRYFLITQYYLKKQKCVLIYYQISKSLKIGLNIAYLNFSTRLDIALVDLISHPQLFDFDHHIIHR